jgi:1-phosphofructokinase family hexose kinase
MARQASFDVVCLSGNPSLDRRIRIPSFERGAVNRATSVESFPGGKAAHVAMASAALDLRPMWVGLLGGAIGEECAAGLRALGISVTSHVASSSSRLNLEIIDDSGSITEILEPGSPPSSDEQNALLQLCENKFKNEWNEAIVAISGSLPRGSAPDFYAKLITKAHSAGLKTFVDTSGEWMLAALAAKPDFVKINAAEAQIIMPAALPDAAWALSVAEELMRRGAASAAVTLGAEGIVWRSKNGAAWCAHPPRLRCISTVGSGDCTLAGFVYAARKGLTGKQAITFAAACGAANCLAKATARISAQEVKSLQQRVAVEALAETRT